MTEKKPLEITPSVTPEIRPGSGQISTSKASITAPQPVEILSQSDAQEEVTEIKSPSVTTTAATDSAPKSSVAVQDTKTPQSAPLAELNINQVLENMTSPLIVELGRVILTISGIGELKTGSIIELSRTPSDAVDLVVAGKSIGKGELVDIEGDLGVRIISLVK
jgi:flagellar motor switch/type III secretory pathway protein FliN